MDLASPTTDPRENKRYYFDNTLLRRIVTPLLRAFFLPIMDMRVNGVEHFPAGGPVVLAANHLSEYDMFPMQFALPRLIFFMAKAELHHNPILDIVLRQLGSFPIERGARDQWALRHAAELLSRGQVLGIYPEGTRGRGRGLLPAKTGAARLAIQTDCPVVLMALDGTQRIFKEFPRRTVVKITLSRPIFPLPEEPALDFTERFMFQLAEMLSPELRGVYAEHPRGFN